MTTAEDGDDEAITEAAKQRLKLAAMTPKARSCAGHPIQYLSGLMSRRLTSFQALALSTTAMTYLLILVGGLVRASGAGLGCPDWPKCFGSWIPPASAAELPSGFDPSQFNATLMWTEYLNRLLGVAVGLLIFATVISAFRNHRRTPAIVWSTLAAFLLVGFQGWLGGVVVEHELAASLVTVHLLVALVIVSLLVYATVYAFLRVGASPSRRVPARGPLLWSLHLLMAITLAQIALGAQVRGAVDDALIHGTPRERALASVGTFDIWHREMALVVVALTFVMFWLTWTRHRGERPLLQSASAIVALVLAQVGFGLWMAYVALTPAAQVAHLTVASLMLGAETVLLLLARWLPANHSEEPPGTIVSNPRRTFV
jgi:cytochrome c oxidase assembly protein subunit 15